MENHFPAISLSELQAFLKYHLTNKMRLYFEKKEFRNLCLYDRFSSLRKVEYDAKLWTPLSEASCIYTSVSLCFRF